MSNTTTSPADAQASTVESDNPLLLSWMGPYGGVPPFGKVRVQHFEPALETAMRRSLAAIDRIASQPAPPTFDNTIAALERSARTLNRVSTIYGVWSSNMSDSAFQAVERRMAPRLAEYSDRITQNAAFFRRIQEVYDSPTKAVLTPEQQRLTWYVHNNFVRAGARLDSTAKARVAEINQQLARLFTQFSQNVLADETDLYLQLDAEADLAGLPQSVRDAAASAAAQKGIPGKWIIVNTRSAMEPFLTFSSRRDLRERAWRQFVNRGDNGGEHDNNQIITDVLALRAERARLLGYPTHAHWRLENAMARTPERALELMEAVWVPAVARVREEVADMQAIADREGGARGAWESRSSRGTIATTRRRFARQSTISTRTR